MKYNRFITAHQLFLMFALFLGPTFHAQTNPSVDSLPKNFYRFYAGEIGGQKVAAEFWSIHGVLEGRYEYKKDQETNLLSSLSEVKGKYRLGEDDGFHDPGENYPIWEIRFKGNTIIGNKKSTNRQKVQPITLKEIQDSEHLPFTYHSKRQSFKAFQDSAYSPSMKVLFAYPVALGNSGKAKWLNDQIKELRGSDSGFSYLKEVYTQLMQQHKKTSKNTNAPADQRRFDQDWYADHQIKIAYNENAYVQLEDYKDEFSGNAHPNKSRSTISFDIKNKRRLRLGNITTMDPKDLQHLLETEFRKDYRLAPTDPLDSILFYDKLPLTKNFSFNQQGIEFTYSTEEIAPYTVGTINIFIPLKKLKTTLVPEFKRRMHLLF